MKLVSLVLAVVLSGCAFVMPKPHDPVMFGSLVDVKMVVNMVQCGNVEYWGVADLQIEKLKLYSQMRKDPQATNIEQLQVAMKKAGESKNKSFCESLVKINKTRIEVISDAWSGR